LLEYDEVKPFKWCHKQCRNRWHKHVGPLPLAMWRETKRVRRGLVLPYCCGKYRCFCVPGAYRRGALALHRLLSSAMLYTCNDVYKCDVAPVYEIDLALVH
jgi:hypothetical protein